MTGKTTPVLSKTVKKCISTVIVNLCYTNIYYIYMYMNIKMVIFYVFKQDEKLNKWERCHCTIAANDSNGLMLIVNVSMLSAATTPTRLECCFFCCVTKVLWPLRRQTLSSLRFFGQKILVMVYSNYLFIYWWIDLSSWFICTCKWKSFLVLSIDAEKCNCRKIYNIYNVFRMHFADTICTYYLRYGFYKKKKNICIKLKKMLCNNYTGAILGFGTYHFFQYIRSVLNNVLKSLLYK